MGLESSGHGHAARRLLPAGLFLPACAAEPRRGSADLELSWGHIFW